MAQKILGYIELVWTCDSCGTKNPGAIKSCTSCGAPQPLDVHFEKVDIETFNFIKDEALIRMADSGPDKHCPYCGTRNLADAETCIKCGADLRVGAVSRPTGTVLEERETENPQDQIAAPQPMAQRAPMPKWASLLVILGVITFCVILGLWLSRMFQTQDSIGTVASTYWERKVIVEEYQRVTLSDWKNNLPGDAEIISCTLEYRYDSDSYEPNSEEICGEPYTVDTGTGIGKVVQDCYYRVYEDYCRYESWAWTEIDSLMSNGVDQNAEWPSVNLANTQRLGQESEKYTIWFDVDGESYSLTTTDFILFEQAYEGSEWVLDINGFGDIVNAEPVY